MTKRQHDTAEVNPPYIVPPVSLIKSKLALNPVALRIAKTLWSFGRAPDNFLKQGVADASLGAKGIFLQNPEVFSLPSFYTPAFL